MYTNITILFIIAIVLGFYFLFISPKLTLVNSVKHDTALHNHLQTIYLGAEYDPRSCTKLKQHIQTFFIQNGKTYEIYGTDKCEAMNLSSLRREQDQIMKYARRIPFRLPNDGHLQRDIENAIDNLEKIIQNYVYDAASRHGQRIY